MVVSISQLTDNNIFDSANPDEAKDRYMRMHEARRTFRVRKRPVLELLEQRRQLLAAVLSQFGDEIIQCDGKPSPLLPDGAGEEILRFEYRIRPFSTTGSNAVLMQKMETTITYGFQSRGLWFKFFARWYFEDPFGVPHSPLLPGPLGTVSVAFLSREALDFHHRMISYGEPCFIGDPLGRPIATLRFIESLDREAFALRVQDVSRAE